MMIADGVSNRASDIHVEPIEGGVVVRYRIDGVLRQVMKIPRSAGLPLISRVKIMSGLDIADRLRPQDGRARVSVNGEPIDLRVSTLPASLGEKVVIRILNQKATALSLDSLGMADDEQKAIRSLLSQQGRDHPGHRPHRLRQDHHPVLRSPRGSGRRHQHRHGRGPGRVPAGPEHRSGAGEREGGADLRVGAAIHPAAGPRCGADRRDPRQGDRPDRAPGLAHRPPGPLHPAHQRRAERGHPSGGHGDGGVQDRSGPSRRRRPAADAAALSRLPRGHDRAGDRAPPALHSAGRNAVPVGRLHRLLDDRLPGEVQHRRSADDDAGAGAPDRRRRHRREDRRSRPGRGHALALCQRASPRALGRIHHRGAAAGHRAAARGGRAPPARRRRPPGPPRAPTGISAPQSRPGPNPPRAGLARVLHGPARGAGPDRCGGR